MTDPVIKRRRFIIAVMAVLVVAVASFLWSRSLFQVDDNTQAIRDSCKAGNAVVAKVNEKFAELTRLFETATPPGQPDPPPNVLAAYEVFKRPIPLTNCNNLSKGD